MYIVAINGVATSGKSTLAKEIAARNNIFIHIEIDRILSTLPKNKYVVEHSSILDLYKHRFIEVWKQGKIPIIDYIMIKYCSFGYIRPIILFTELEKLILNYPKVMKERNSTIGGTDVIIKQFTQIYTCNKSYSNLQLVGTIDFNKIKQAYKKYYKFNFDSEENLENTIVELKILLNSHYKTDISNIYIRKGVGNPLFINKHSVESRYHYFSQYLLPLIESDIKKIMSKSTILESSDQLDELNKLSLDSLKEISPKGYYEENKPNDQDDKNNTKEIEIKINSFIELSKDIILSDEEKIKLNELLNNIKNPEQVIHPDALIEICSHFKSNKQLRELLASLILNYMTELSKKNNVASILYKSLLKLN